VSYLRGTRGLLVLDNLEHLTAAAGAIADLVAACPALVVLATSRTPLLVAGEQEYLVPPLAVPDAAEAPSLDRLQQVGAVRLLVDRARAVQPRFALTDDNAAAVAEVCRRLDGLPLAIELAAARVRVLSVAQIAARLGEAFGPAGLADPADRHPDHGGRFRLLTSESATVEQRHRTLWATLEWSHALLSEAEAVLLRRLSVFAGGWTLEAAEAVCGLEPLEPFGLLDLLTGLVAKSLVVAEPDGGEVRYRLLETIRSYAGRKLDRAGETAVVRGGHLAWCLGLAEQAAAEIHGRRGTAWLARLAREQDNLRAALAWTRTSAERLAAGLQLAGALQRFWFLHLHGRDEGRRWLDGLLEQAEQAGWPGVSPTVRARALQGAGEMRHGRDFAARATLIGQALELYRAAGDQHRLAECLCLMGDAARYCGDDARGFALVEESLALGRQLGDEEVVAFALYELGALELNRHRHERARALAGECLSLAREVGGPWVLPLALRLMGRAAMSVGDFQLAKTVLAEDLLLEQERGITGGPMTRRFLGDIALREGDGRSAAGHFAAALALAQEVGSTWEIGSALIGLAGAARLGGRHARAARLLGAGERLTVATAARPATFQAASPEPLIAATRLSLGDEPFAAAWAEGQRMTLDQAIAYAQGDD
jgi:predicted ATPase